MTESKKKRRGRPPGSKNKPKLKAQIAPTKADLPEPYLPPSPEEIGALRGLYASNRGISDPDSPAYDAGDDLEWAQANLRAIGQSPWASHLSSTMGFVVKETIQKLWKKNSRPPAMDEIVIETGLPWEAVEDVVWCLVEDEKLIRINEILIPVNVEKRKPEPEPEEGTGYEASVVGDASEGEDGSAEV